MDPDNTTTFMFNSERPFDMDTISELSNCESWPTKTYTAEDMREARSGGWREGFLGGIIVGAIGTLCLIVGLMACFHWLPKEVAS